MLDKLAEAHPGAKAVMDTAGRILQRDLWAHFAAGNPAAFARNVDIQLGVFVANHICLDALNAAGISAGLSLGLSLGEYNHLVHIGALDFEEGLKAVCARGMAYDEGPKGCMASVQPIALEELQALVDSTGGHGVLEIVNLNSPTQHVIAGEEAAVRRALAVLESEHYVQGQVIEQHLPIHSSLFKGVGERFGAALRQLRFQPPRMPYFPNRIGSPLPAASPAMLRTILEEHVYSPVLWRKSIDYVLQAHPDAVFVEVGPRAVLHNLLQRKWTQNARHTVDSADNRAAHFAQLTAELRDR
jgi:[acyl-carrier-protein] S-malonyltransferase